MKILCYIRRASGAACLLFLVMSLQLINVLQMRDEVTFGAVDRKLPIDGRFTPRIGAERYAEQQ